MCAVCICMCVLLWCRPVRCMCVALLLHIQQSNTHTRTHPHPQLPLHNPRTTSHHFPSLPPSLSPFISPCSTHSHPQLNLAIIEDDVVNSLVATPQFVASFPIAPSTNSATLQYWGDPGNSYTASVTADDPAIVSASLPFPDTGTSRCLWW